MSTISSPRAPSTHDTPTSSGRPSLDTLNSTSAIRSESPSSLPPGGQPRRNNRAALRDYYNLKQEPQPQRDNSTTSTSSIQTTLGLGDTLQPKSPHSSPLAPELDSPEFSPDEYIQDLLSISSLSAILKVENALVSEIRNLDGERKALVYDNYSKLIRAVETIGGLRGNFEVGVGEKGLGTLAPAVGFVADTAAGLVENMRNMSGRDSALGARDGWAKKKVQKDTVRWVLSAPGRLRVLVGEGKRDEAVREWGEVKRLLERWEGVEGVEEVTRECEDAMDGVEREGG